MTSSLVGSEMCIRDSACPPSFEFVCSFATQVVDVEFSRGVLGMGSGFWPVSYTHLTLPTICSV
eukprot:9962585-Prorocentrum_lima.AAC.1